MRAIYQVYLIIAECSPLKTWSVRRSREVVRFNYELWTMHYALMEAPALMYLLFFCLIKLDAVGQKNKKYVLLSKIFLSQFSVFPGYDFANVVQFVKGSHRSEVIDVEVANLVAHLTQHRVIELEER